MKNLKIPKKIWKKIQEIKNKQNLSSFPETIEYLINAKPRSSKSLQEIRSLVDEIKPTHEEEFTKKQSVIEIQCMICDGPPFELEETGCNETGIMCPHCKYSHAIVIREEG